MVSTNFNTKETQENMRLFKNFCKSLDEKYKDIANATCKEIELIYYLYFSERKGCHKGFMHRRKYMRAQLKLNELLKNPKTHMLDLVKAFPPHLGFRLTVTCKEN